MVVVFLHAKPVHCHIMVFVFLYVLLYSRFIQADHTYIITFRSEVPVPKLIFQVRMLIKHHQGTFPFQISHILQHAVLRRYVYQHVRVIRHQVPFYNFHTFVTA
jgi:hypothetical protein